MACLTLVVWQTTKPCGGQRFNDTGKQQNTVQEVTPQIAESLGLESTGGVVVTAIEPGGPGNEAGFRPGDVILEIDRQPIGNLKDFRSATAKIKKGKGILFLIQRGETTLFLAMKSR